MDKFEGLIRRIVKNFNAAGIDYMFTGALAASYYGTPRTTMDIDIVVKVPPENLQTRLVAPLKKANMQVNAQKINDAFKSGFRIITLKDKRTPFTLDVILSEDKKLEKKPGTILGLPTFYQTPEGLILSKLHMIKATVPKERAIEDKDDVKAILRYTEVNMKALKRRAQKESTFAILEELTYKIFSFKSCRKEWTTLKNKKERGG
ncbi:MAG: hypothetical protein AOA66_1605 [Candidatus Bathyarchaeota archaeon BA2]|nr:MAG: hypothetical protein AOA66_1605 [Candidatus Bathyarchaeota archaeon BA2]